MIAIPVPFIVAALLALLFGRLLLRRDAPRPIWFVALLLLMVIQSTLVGLRWSLGSDPVKALRAISASAIPPLAYLCFATMRTVPWSHGLWQRSLMITVPPLLIFLCAISAPQFVDALLLIDSLVFGLALLAMIRRGPDVFGNARIDSALTAFRALQLMTIILFVNALLDMIISSDFLWFQGAHAPLIVSIGGLIGLLVMGCAAILAERAESPDTPEPKPDPAPPTQADQQVMALLHQALIEQKLYQDPDLTLNRLARKIGQTTRRISEAVNRQTQKNVSQFVNEHRVKEACRLLETGDLPVTQIMFAAGFQTKSNFNREFRRVTGKNPSEWRRSVCEIEP